MRVKILSKWRVALLLVASAIAVFAAGYVSNHLSADACRLATADWADVKLTQSTWPGKCRFVEPASFHLPYLASVDYQIQTGSAGRFGGRRHFLCLFGLPVCVGDSRTWCE